FLSLWGPSAGSGPSSVDGSAPPPPRGAPGPANAPGGAVCLGNSRRLRVMSFDSDTFRKVMGHFVTGVTVVTTLENGEPQGITVNALSSVSLEPPLVMVALDRRRHITPKVHASGQFAVNVLGEHQQLL